MPGDTTSPVLPSPEQQGAVGARPPALAEGLELFGEQPGSGFATPPSLVRRTDGTMLQLTPLLYAVLEAVDGRRDHAQIAEHVSQSVGRLLQPEDVATLLDGKLRPLGVLAMADGSQPEVRTAEPLLGLRFRHVVSDPDKTRRLTAPFAWLFHPAVVAPVVLAFFLTAGWVLFREGLGAATFEAFDSPGLLLLIIGFTVLSAGLHEFGHAAACKYGGATPGAMGFGLYLVWPAFYTEVGDSYRLGRAGRLRVDLGGFYFNAIVAVASWAIWLVTGLDALLLLIAAQVLQMVRQLTPLVRFDGYHVLADLTGVPDLYGRIGPTFRGLLPWNWGKPETKVLKPGARLIVTAWVLIAVPLLLGTLLLMVLALPRVVATAWASLNREVDQFGDHLQDGQPAGAILDVLSSVAVVLPLLGLGYLLVSLTRRIGAKLWTATSDRPVRRGLLIATFLALAALLAVSWWPREDTYRPITAADRGTVLDAVFVARSTPLGTAASPAADTPSGSGAVRGSGVRDGDIAAAPAFYASPTVPQPTQDEAQLAVVLLPRDGSTPWIFPFDKPGAPGPGDNQAFALNTTDGTTVYDVAFAFVWADDGTVLNKNEAYAFASCQDCTTIAIAFQIVLVIGQADVAIPQNLAGSLNYACIQCVTQALAQQLVLTLPGAPSEATTAELEALFAEIQEFGANLEGLNIEQVRARLTEYEAQLLEVVGDEITLQQVAPSGSPRASAGASSSPDPQRSASPSPSARSGTSPSPTPRVSSDASPSTSPSPRDEPSPSPSATS